MSQRRLLLFKWLMIVLPASTVALVHSLLQHAPGEGHTGGAPTLPSILLVTLVGIVLTYIFVEILFRVLQKLQANALARERDMQTMQAVMQERERLSRELHDGVAQLVAHLLLRLDTIKELVETDRTQEAGAELERLRSLADELYEDIGESITGLRANMAEQGLVRALRDYVDQFEERHEIPTSLETDEAADQLAPLAALQVFRLVQEALTNVRKHAAARKVMITLLSTELGELEVIITDNGQGFVPGVQRNGKARPLGLTSMRERVEALGGTFEISSQPGSGTQVTAIIPIPPARKENPNAILAAPAR